MEWTAKAQEWKKVFEAFDAGKASRKTGAAQAALAHIATNYRREKELRNEYRDKPKVFLAVHRAKIQPEIDAFHAWLTDKADKVVPSTLLGKPRGMWHLTMAETDPISR